MGGMAVEMAVANLKDGTKPKSVQLDYVVADKANLDQPDTQKYLYKAK
jgi:ABC-type sugar transport system substrate-binding protein